MSEWKILLFSFIFPTIFSEPSQLKFLMNSPDEDLVSSSSHTPRVVADSFRQGPNVYAALSSSDPSNTKPPLSTKANFYDSQGEHDAVPWLLHECNVIVFTFSGKPVYTRYGSEDLIAGFTGTLQALVSKFSSVGFTSGEDNLRCISIGSTRMEFLNKSPLILVCVSRHARVPRLALQRLLAAVHSQLTFVLTSGVNKTLEMRPNFDIRSLLGGTKALLGNLISWMHRDMLLCIRDCAVEPLPLPVDTRTSISNVLQQKVPACTLLSVLLSGHRLVATSAPPDAQPLISAADLVLLINLVVSSSSMRAAQSWTPVCLPSLSSEAFVYGYVQYLSSEVVHVAISASPDNENFYAMSKHGEFLRAFFASTTDLETVAEWDLKCPLTVSGVPELDGGSERREALSRVRHCAIVLNQSKQIFSSRIIPGPETECMQKGTDKFKNVFRNYQQCLELLWATPSPSQQVSVTSGNDFVFVWTTSEFQFFLTAPRGVDVSVVTHVYQWMREHEQTLFLSNIATTGASGTRLNTKAPSLW